MYWPCSGKTTALAAWIFSRHWKMTALGTLFSHRKRKYVYAASPVHRFFWSTSDFFVIGAQCTDSLVNVFDRTMFGAESDLEVSETIH